tara:strand:+ start:387 stop:554 length:168 start_codon:yes stop_codon:yes gene_type:complete
MVPLLNLSESIQMEKRMANIKVGGPMGIKSIYTISKKTKVSAPTSNGIQMENYLH